MYNAQPHAALEMDSFILLLTLLEGLEMTHFSGSGKQYDHATGSKRHENNQV